MTKKLKEREIIQFIPGVEICHCHRKGMAAGIGAIHPQLDSGKMDASVELAFSFLSGTHSPSDHCHVVVDIVYCLYCFNCVPKLHGNLLVCR